MRRYAGRYIVAGAILLVSALVAAIQFGGASPIVAQLETRISPDGPEQLPLVYVHGYNDDGASWGESTGPYWNALRDVTEGSGNPLTTPVENYAVQFGTPDRDPFANADEGWAVLHTPAQMALPPLEEAVPGGGYNAYNSPDPVAYFLENKHLLLAYVPVCEVYLPLPDNCYIPAVEFINGLSERRVRSNYNRNGRAEDHAENLQEMLRREFGGGGKFADLRQLNIITHSAGGIDTRALLALLNGSDYRSEQERVANVMFTAPPFGGSTIAEVANIIYDDDLNTTVVTNPWFEAVVANQVEPPIKVFLRSMIAMRPSNTLSDQQVNDTIDLFADAARLLGHDLLSYGHGASALLVEAIRLVRPVVSDLFGFPGTPKVDVDLRPSGAITNLRDWERNPHTVQFVTWGEAGVFGIGYNLSPDLADIADDNYGTIDDITVSGYLKAFPGDTALSNVSARTLTTDAPGGWMVPLQSYDLTHGDLIVDTFETGAKWIEALMAPVTTLRVIGPVKVADLSDRYYVVSPDFTFDFLPEARTFRDQWGKQITVRPPTDPGTGGVQYRVISYPDGGGPVFWEWQDLDVTQSAAVFETQDVSFSDLESQYDLSGETLFRLQWRSTNKLGGREAIRSVWFRIDGEPPTVRSIRVVDTADEGDTSEIHGRSPVRSGFRAVRGKLALSRKSTVPYQSLLVGQVESQWVVRQSNRIKVLKIDFDSAGTITYVWDDATKLLSDPQTLVNRDFLGQVLNVLDPGPHTLYFYTEDGAGNRSDPQSVTVLVDSQPPVTALNYQSAHPLGIVVGPNTPLQFDAQDAELGAATGFLTVPGHPDGGVGVGSSFTLGETDLSQAASQGLFGAFVTLSAEASDRVGNTVTNSYEVFYDWTAPDLQMGSVGDSIQLADGNYRTTERTIEIRLTGGEGHPVEWTAAQPGGRLAGGQATLLTGLRGVYAANVRLMDGLNIISFRTEDPVGNLATAAVTVERVHELVTGADARQIELIARGAAGVAVSHDGSTFLFDSRRADVIDGDTNGEGDVFAWRNGVVTRVSTNSAGEQPVGGESRKPAISGNGRYAYFLSAATNLVPEVTSGANLYVKDLLTDQIAIVSRDLSGNPANLSTFSANVGYLRTCATEDGRYVFFEDRFGSYVVGDSNGNFDVFVADLDPDVDGDFFEGNYAIHRVSVAPGGNEGTGGSSSTGGSRHPACSSDGLHFVYDTSHTDLIPNDNNGQFDPVLARLNGIDSAGTIDFSDVSIAPLSVIPIGQPNFGQLHSNGGRWPSIDRSGQLAIFSTTGNLGFEDNNREGLEQDVYYAVPTGVFELRIPALLYPGSAADGSSTDPITSMSISDRDSFNGTLVRAAFVGTVRGLAQVDRLDPTADVADLFVRATGLGWQKINWIADDIPTTQRVIDGGITADGRWAWWTTLERYPGVEVEQGSQVLYRRRVDSDDTGVAVTVVGNPITTETGAAATLNVVLKSRPTVDEVTVRVEVTDPTEGAADSETLSFTSQNWDDPQPVIVSGLNDADSDGDVEYGIRFTPTSADSLYDDTGGAEVLLTNQDNDAPPRAPDITTQPSSLTVTVGESATFSVDASGVPAPTYQWSIDGQPIQGQTSE